MKIDKVYIACCKTDYYLTKICVASIRYWNSSIPLYLLKDHSQGNFDTTDLEKAFNVSILQMKTDQPGPYGKLFVYAEENESRIFVIDSDIVWIRDAIKELEFFSEDIIIQGYNPDEFDKEINSWYFNMPNLHKHYTYNYPGFLFNAGQLVCNTSLFSRNDFDNIINLKEKKSPKPIFDNIFLCEDQGILNYVFAKKIETSSVNYRHHKFYTWGYDKAINEIDIKQNNVPTHFPSLIHWVGKKTGLISGLPGNKILDFYEKYYYSKINNGKIKIAVARSLRIIKHPIGYLKTIVKKVIHS
jgi:hypothetical protein